MKPFWSLVSLTIKTTLNRRLIWSIVAVSALLTAAIVLFANMSLDQTARLAADFALATTILVTIITSIIITANSVLAEQDRGILLIMLPKPTSRTTFLVAKYVGLLISTLVMYTLVCAIVFGGVAIWQPLPWTDVLLTAFASSLELVVLLGIATLAASFTTPILATLVTLSLFITGHVLSLIVFATNQSPTIIRWIAQAIYYLLPNLEKFNIREVYISAHTLSAGYYGWMIVYALVYTAATLLIATTIFNKREW